MKHYSSRATRLSFLETVNCVVFWPIHWKVHGAALKDFLMTSPGSYAHESKIPCKIAHHVLWSRRLIFLFVNSVGCSVILVAGNWASLLIKKCQNCYRVLDLFWHDNIFAKPRSKMTTLPNFSRKNDAGLRELNVVLWENFVIVLALVLESRSPITKVYGFFVPRTKNHPRLD